jgi:cysteine desulfuration protein SufE
VPTLDDIIGRFRSVDDELRLALLLDYSKRLPEIPERLAPERDAGLHRVPECMTPVFLWMEDDAGTLRMHVDVAEEAPMVQGVLAVIVEGMADRPLGEAPDLPSDLISRLGLARQIRMQRAVGLNAIIGRIRKGVEALREGEAA